MKNQLFLIGLIISLFSVFFTACDDILADVGEGIEQGIEETFCPSITTGYVHQQETRNAVFTPCSVTSGASKFELQMTINGSTFTYDADATLDNIPHDAEIPLKVTYSGPIMIGVKLMSQGAPLTGGEQHYGSCASKFMNEQLQAVTNNTDYCMIELEDTLGASLTENRETRVIAYNSNESERISILINYAE